MALSIGALLDGRYMVASVLGRGGFATVYAATHVVLGSAHAIKVLHGGVDEDARQRMLREGRMMSRLVHPNLVRVTDVVAVEDGVALVMDRVDGETLRALLDRGAPPPDVAEALALGVLRGVAAAHAGGLVHRDLKPENVLIGPDGVARVTDFGIARAADPALRGAETRTGIGMGTPGYMAPEAYADVAAVDARADVYALGAMLYELVSGRRAFPQGAPWMDQYQRACRAAFTPLASLCPDLPAHRVATIRAALSPSPEARPADAAALAARWQGEGTGLVVTPADTVRLDLGDAPGEAPPPPSRHHLPAERDPFVGRTLELQALARHLAEGARLVTVLGIGGTGKTRFVVHFGWTQLAAWPGGVWFCDLSEARDFDGIARAVATALDVPLDRDPLAQLGRVIRSRGRALVILDNVEQVLRPAADAVHRWLDVAPEATLLVTSRERLGVVGEQTLPLNPLDQDAAVRLFQARAAAVHASLQPEEERSVVALVALLDHLPLAIELAAARARVLTPSAMLSRMRDRFRLLTSGGGRPERHATLRAMLDWSWELLSPEEQMGLAQLSVFAGGFTLDAAEAVLDLGEAWVVDVLQSLVDRSLVRVVSTERLDLLSSVQAYAAERLQVMGGRLAAEARHGACLAEAGTAAALVGLDRQGGVELRRALALELDNLLVACSRAQARRDDQIAAQLALAAWAVIELRGPFPVGLALLRAVVGLEGVSTSTRIDLHRAAGRALDLYGRLPEARAHYDAALALSRETAARRSEGQILNNLGTWSFHQGRHADALALFQEGLRCVREAGLPEDEAPAAGQPGRVVRAGGGPRRGAPLL